jgi:2-polyprenyl-3-methyl-5-hydroxy-6-metoxy-1,4-benzoquinol methylase
MDLKEEEILGDQVDAHWYYKAKAAALLKDCAGLKPISILDIGAGSGFFSRQLLAHTSAARATCVDIGYAHDHDEQCCGKALRFRRAINTSDADLVLAMDVIEHVGDDAALMRPYVDLVPSGARFIFSVPAFKFLWSGHDVFLGHHRRYTLAGLEHSIATFGLVLDWSHYYYAFVFPLAAATRVLERVTSGQRGEPKSQLRRHGAVVNATLSSLCAVERPLMRANKLGGLTVFAGCHKP